MKTRIYLYVTHSNPSTIVGLAKNFSKVPHVIHLLAKIDSEGKYTLLPHKNYFKSEEELFAYINTLASVYHINADATLKTLFSERSFGELTLSKAEIIDISLVVKNGNYILTCQFNRVFPGQDQLIAYLHTLAPVIQVSCDANLEDVAGMKIEKMRTLLEKSHAKRTILFMSTEECLPQAQAFLKGDNGRLSIHLKQGVVVMRNDVGDAIRQKKHFSLVGCETHLKKEASARIILKALQRNIEFKRLPPLINSEYEGVTQPLTPIDFPLDDNSMSLESPTKLSPTTSFFESPKKVSNFSFKYFSIKNYFNAIPKIVPEEDELQETINQESRNKPC